MDKDKVAHTDIVNNGFTVLIECNLHLDTAHVWDNVRGLLEILEYGSLVVRGITETLQRKPRGVAQTWENLRSVQERSRRT